MPTYGAPSDNGMSVDENANHSVTISREEYERLNRLEREMEALKEMIKAQSAQQAQAPPPPPPPQQTYAPTTSAPVPPDNSSALDDLLRRPRHSLPDVPLYDGKAYNYAQFETKLRVKISADRKAIGSEHNCVLYGYNRLGEYAANLMQPWLDTKLTEN
ncbi:hypothetical protein KEM54_005041, partial [Ascosphaera aggregata]